MRLRLVIGIAVLPLVLPACFSSTSVDDAPTPSQGDDSGPDAAAMPGPDATMTEPMEAAVQEASTPTPEAAAEAAAVDAGPVAVTVVVVNDLGPEPGASVVFQDAAGHALTTVTTDGSGKATQVVDAGSQVTAVLGTPENIQLVTIEGVAPGDVLTVHDSTASTVANGQGVSIDSLPDTAAPAETATYQVNIGNCVGNFTSTPMQMEVYANCASGGTFPVLVQAFDSNPEGPALLGFTYQNGNALPVDGGTAHVTLNGAWSTASATQSVSVTNLPDTVQTYASYSEVAGGVAYGQPTFVTGDQDANATATFPVHPGYPVSAQNEANISAGRGGATAVSAIATRSAPSDGGAISFDISTLLPLLDDVTLDSSQAGRPTVSWVTEAGSLASASGTMVVFNWSATDDASGIAGTWTIVAPPAATSVQAPELPGPLAGRAPSADATFFLPANVIVVQGSFLTDYAQVRALSSTLPATTPLIIDQFNTGAVIPPLPVDGTLRMTAFTVNAD